MRAAAGRDCAPASSARPPRRSSTSPTTSTPSATTSAARVDAPVTLVEYGDFECPYCGRRRADDRASCSTHLGDELRYVFRHLPLTDVHPNAQLAAEAAEAAARPGRVLGDARPAARPTRASSRLATSTATPRRWASTSTRFSDDLRRRRYAPRVAEDVAERRRQRRLRHADVLHQRPPPPGRLRRRHAHARGQGRGAGAAALSAPTSSST